MAMRRINKLHFNVKMKENFLFGHRRYRKLLSNGTSPMHAYANRSAKWVNWTWSAWIDKCWYGGRTNLNVLVRLYPSDPEAVRTHLYTIFRDSIEIAELVWVPFRPMESSMLRSWPAELCQWPQPAIISDWCRSRWWMVQCPTDQSHNGRPPIKPEGYHCGEQPELAELDPPKETSTPTSPRGGHCEFAFAWGTSQLQLAPRMSARYSKHTYPELIHSSPNGNQWQRRESNKPDPTPKKDHK